MENLAKEIQSLNTISARIDLKKLNSTNANPNQGESSPRSLTSYLERIQKQSTHVNANISPLLPKGSG